MICFKQSTTISVVSNGYFNGFVAAFMVQHDLWATLGIRYYNARKTSIRSRKVFSLKQNTLYFNY